MKWKYFSLLVADGRHDDGRITDTIITNAAEAVLEFNPEIYPDSEKMPLNKKLIYCYLMTLANRRGLIEDDKVKKAKDFLDLLYTKESFIDEQLLKAGYNKIEKKQLQEFNGRRFHTEVERHCKKYFDQGNYFHAVHEGCKAYNNKIKKLSGSQKDGVALMQTELSQGGNIKINGNKSESEKNEQIGIKALSEGLMSAIRNPTAHETALEWDISEIECLEILSLISYLFRKLGNVE